MGGEVMVTTLDATGWPIHVGARVYRRPRPSRIAPGGGDLPGVSGRVEKIEPRTVDSPGLKTEADAVLTVTEFETGGTRYLLASEVRVQTGETKASRRYTLEQQSAPKARRRKGR